MLQDEKLFKKGINNIRNDKYMVIIKENYFIFIYKYLKNSKTYGTIAHGASGSKENSVVFLY